jgi:molecular chaperone GrpE
MENTEIKEELDNKAEMRQEDAAAPAEGSTAAETESNKELDKLKEELAGAKDKYIRLYSEFENFRRRTAREKSEMVLSANEQLIKALIPVVDDFERAEKSIRDNSDQSAQGFLLIFTKLKKILEGAGVKPMEVQPGADFNTDLHEAITQIPAPEPSLKGKIVEVVEKGYQLGDKVIRFAKVIVGS